MRGRPRTTSEQTRTRCTLVLYGTVGQEGIAQNASQLTEQGRQGSGCVSELILVLVWLLVLV